ncbi:MAG: PAS domain S-box protein [Bacteroidetes bacterium]|nr:PAS domain S-box protein [Bacteroidota bacterium]
MERVKSRIILNVSSDDSHRNWVTKTLMRAGFDLWEARTAKEAVEKARKAPDVIVLHDLLHDRSSIQVCHQLKDSPSTTNVPILYISQTYNTTEIQLENLLAIIDCYLMYPVESIELISHVNNLLRIREIQENFYQSEERFRRLTEHANDMIYRYELHPKEGFTYVNPAATAIVGYMPEEFYSDHTLGLRLLHPEDREHLLNYFRDVRKWNEPLTVRWIHKSGKVVWIEQKVAPVYDQNGTLIAIEGIARDITERKIADEKVQESEETYRNLFHNAQVGLYRTRIADGKVLESNEQLARMFGYESREEFIAEFVMSKNYVEPGRRQQLLDEITRNGTVKNFEAQFYKKDGTTFWARLSAKIYPHKGWIEGVAEDITKQKEAEVAIRESEKRYRELIEFAPFGVLLTDRNGTIVYENPAMRKIIGVPEGEESKALRAELATLSSVVVAGVSEKIRSVLKGKHVNVFELPFTSIYGKKTYLTAEGIPLKDNEGNVTGGLYVIQDVTERKKAEEALLKRTEELEKIHRIGEKLHHLHTKATLVQELETILNEIAGGNYGAVLLIDEQTKKLVPFALTLNEHSVNGAVREKESIFSRATVVGQGITGKVAETGESICVGDVTTDSRYYPMRDNVKSELCVPIKIGNKVIGVLNFESSEYNAYDTSDQRVAETIASQIGVALQNAELYETLQRELSERIRIENELRKSNEKVQENERRLAHIVETVPSGITFVDATGRITFANPAAEKILGLTQYDILHRTYDSPEWKITSVDGDPFPDEQLPFAVVKRTLQPIYNVEHAIAHPDGHRVVLSVNAAPVLSDANEFLGMIAALTDITELKETEKTLKKLMNRQQALLEAIPDIVAETDINKTYTWANKAGIEFFGDDMIGKPANYFFVGFQDTYQIVQPLYEGREEIIYLESWQRRKDGQERLLAWWCRTLKDENGRVIGALSSARDITEQRRAEEKLKETIEKYQTLFNQSVEGIYVHECDGKIVEVNQMACKQSGYTQEELLQMNVLDFIAQDSAEKNLSKAEILQQWREWKAGETYTIVAHHIHKTGYIYPVEITAGIVKFSNKNLILAIVKDITERFQAEQAVRESEEKYRLLAETTPDFIVLHDTNGKLLYVNESAAKFSGVDRKTVLGQSMLDLLPPNNRAELEDHLRRRQRGDTSIFHYETEMVNSQGTQCYLDVYSAPIIVEGRIEQVLIVARDVTERKRMEQELLRQEEQLRQIQKMEAIGQLASGIAHDFNNILGIILGHASQLLLCAEIPEKCRRSIAIIERTTERGADLVKQLLTIARKTEPVVAPVNIQEMIIELAKMLRETFPKNIEVVTNVKRTIPFVLADASQVHQILMNLCVNARDAMPKGGKLTIETDLYPRELISSIHPGVTADTYVCIRVSDTGSGIPPEVLPRIFDPFFTTKSVGKGTGLGLSMVHSIVQNHNGFIDVDTKVGEGTTFSVYLPLPQIPNSDVVPKDEKVSVDIVEGGAETILIIEDEDPLRELLVTTLKEKGYHVLSARDGKEGLQLYLEHKNEIALTITDLGLPGITGDEIFRKIRHGDKNAKVIIATGFIEPEVKMTLFEEGVTEILQKPYQPKQILQKVRDVLDRH